MLTPQQQTIVDHIKTTDGLTLINAVAGAGKTFTLVEIAKSINPDNGLYLAYNKAIAVEAKRKFPKSVHCATTHSLAFGPTVGNRKTSPSFFNYKDIKEIKSNEEKVDFIGCFKQFCVSKYTTFADFATEYDLPEHYAVLGSKYFKLMAEDQISYPHEFYLKYFHLLLATDQLEYQPFDIIMLDEAGDLNEVTLEIFKLLPSAKKVMVGDPHQNIYSFNHTINCFKIMESEGTTFPMSKSFRVADHIAERIEKFCNKYLHENMSFEGVPLEDTTINDRAYIARTNTSLINKMMELNELGTPYTLTRNPDNIFKLPLLVCGLKPNSFITNVEYKHLQDDVNEYYNNRYVLKEQFPTLFSYLIDVHSSDKQLVNTIRLVSKWTANRIVSCYKSAKSHVKAKTNYYLGTAHSMKGLEADEVTIAPDLNEAILDAVLFAEMSPDKPMPEEHITELNLYYVATSRARKKLINAAHL